MIVKFTNDHGWRQRVTDAKLILAFELNKHISPLINTFKNNPEGYTCSAFVQMIIRGQSIDKLALLSTMKDLATNDVREKHLHKTINGAIDRVSA